MNPLFKANEIAAKKLKAEEKKILSLLADAVNRAKWAYCLADDLKSKVNLKVVQS